MVLLAAVFCAGLSFAFVAVRSNLHAAPGDVPDVPRIASVVGGESHDVIKQRAIVFSPDKGGVAVLQYFEDRGFLNGKAGIQVWLGRSMAHPASYNLVYDSRGDGPDIEWVDERHIVLTFGTPRGAKVLPPMIPSLPSLALRRAGDVEVLYRIVNEVSESSYRKSLQTWEQRSREDSWRYYPLSLRYEKMDDDRSHYGSAYEFAQKLWMEYLVFRSWTFGGEERPWKRQHALEKLDYDVEDVILSPDGSRVARIVSSHNTTQPKGTASYDVVVGQRDDPREQGTIVFSSLDGMPAVAWTDSSNLAITLAYLPRVQTSLHRAGEFAISYKIADRLREIQFHNNIRRWKQQEEEFERKQVPRTIFEAEMAELDRRIQQQTRYYMQFQDWVGMNVPEKER